MKTTFTKEKTRETRVIGFIAAIACIVLMLCAPAFAAIELENPFSDEDYNVSVHNGNMAWVGSDANGGNIFHWDGISITQVTTDRLSVDSPSVYNGTVAWEDWLDDGDGGYAVFYWNGTTTVQYGTGGDGINYCLPSLYDGKIAFVGADETGTDIYYYRGGSILQIPLSGNDFNPSVHDGNIAWESAAGGIYRSIDGGCAIQVSSSGSDPSIYYNGAQVTVAWQAWGGNSREIFYWDGFTTIQVTNNLYSDRHPSLYDGTIAWERMDGDKEIMYWDGTTISQITNNATHDEDPSLSGNLVAWVNSAGNIDKIWYTSVINPVAYESITAAVNTTFNFGYTLSELDQLLALYEAGKAAENPGDIAIGTKIWSYLDDLPEQELHDVGTAYEYGGKWYIKLGSGLEGGEGGGGGGVPELPAGIAPLAMLLFGIVIKCRLKHREMI